MAYLWRFEPEETYRETKRKAYVPRKERRESWVAPEHARVAQSMRKDYPRNERGEVIPNTKKELVIDVRPSIMVPPRKTKTGWK